MLRIWGRTNSVNVKKVLWAAEELGLKYERIDAGMQYGVVDTPEYRKLNPNGLVPTLEDDGFVLWESHAIVRYLAAKYGAGSLWPEDLQVRASADRWMDWVTSTFSVPYRTVFWGLVRTPPEKRDMAAIEMATMKCTELLRLVDDALGRYAYLVHPQLTMGDIPLGCFIHPWFNMPLERPELANLAAWYRRLCERPAYAAVVKLPLT